MKTRDSDIREEKRIRRQDDDFRSRSKDDLISRDDRRSRQHRDYDSAPRSRENFDRKERDRSNRHDRDRLEPNVKYDSDRRDEKGSRR